MEIIIRERRKNGSKGFNREGDWKGSGIVSCRDIGFYILFGNQETKDGNDDCKRVSPQKGLVKTRGG